METLKKLFVRNYINQKQKSETNVDFSQLIVIAQKWERYTKIVNHTLEG